jgi:DNA-binding IclR family transcriptional regulator
MPASLVGLVEPKTLSILDVLLNDPTKLFHLNSLAASSNVPVTSTARIIKRLVKHGFADELKVGKLSVYKLADNDKMRKMQAL